MRIVYSTLSYFNIQLYVQDMWCYLLLLVFNGPAMYHNGKSVQSKKISSLVGSQYRINLSNLLNNIIRWQATYTTDYNARHSNRRHFWFIEFCYVLYYISLGGISDIGRILQFKLIQAVHCIYHPMFLFDQAIWLFIHVVPHTDNIWSDAFYIYCLHLKFLLCLWMLLIYIYGSFVSELFM